MNGVAVVGASGPLGTFLHEYLSLLGHPVRPLARRSPLPEDRVDVLSTDPSGALEGATGVVYCAWDTTDRREAAQTAHVQAAARWARASAARDVPFLFTSTVLAAVSSSSYGRHKLLAEQAVAAVGGVSLRIGLVVDDAYPFLATRLRRLGSRFPAAAGLLDVPVFALGTPAVGAAVAAELAAPRAGATVWLAPDGPCSLREVVVWGGGRRPRGSFRGDGGRLLRAVARLPVPGRAAARNIDALQGLLAPITRPADVAAPATPVTADSWQEPLVPLRR